MIETDIWCAAHKMIQMHQFDAGWHAALRADHLLEQGDVEGHHAWLRIVRAIKELQNIKPTEKDMRH
jgi:ABC-type Zn uptake system ZnuABC Zn-binding protein ZnuA